MSAPEYVTRRADLSISAKQATEFLRNGFVGRLGSTGLDGWPYVVPLLYVYDDNVIYLHQGHQAGHLRTNLANNTKVCFLVDKPGHVYGYGRFECDSSVSYTSVMAFGTIDFVRSEQGKRTFCERLMDKYGKQVGGRPAGSFPRLDMISVMALSIDRMTGKAISLPAEEARWPLRDRTRSPGYVAQHSIKPIV